jgi:chromosome segregation ATPase
MGLELEKIESVLDALEELQSNCDLTVIKLSEPITSSQPQQSRQRASDASNSSLDGPTPASLEADLAHYTELFAKLRFSYVEQVTKEKFIRAIVGDPPLIVTMQENLELEKENAAAKAELKSLKLEVANMVSELEQKGRDLSQRYENVQLETMKLRELPNKTQELEARIMELKAAQDLHGSDPNLNLPLAKTLDLVARRKREQQELSRELEALQAKVPRKRKEADRLRAELQPLETKRQNSTTAAREARRRKEAALGGVADDLEQRARWYRASETFLKQALDIQG